MSWRHISVCAYVPACLPLQVYKLTEHQHDDWIVGGCLWPGLCFLLCDAA